MKSLPFYLVILLTAIAMSTSISATTIGFTYSAPTSISGSVELSPERIAAKFVSMKIPTVRLLDSTPEMIHAFAYTNVSLLLSVPNTLVPILASNRSFAMNWLHLHVLPFHRHTKISTISVGNDLISDVSPLFLLRAMQNIHLSLSDLRIYNVSVSTTFSFFDIIRSSAAQFNKSEMVNIVPILRFLEETNSSLLVSLCPYDMFRSNCSIPIGNDLFDIMPVEVREDLATGSRFRKIFDMMVDVVYGSMAVTGHENLPVIVAETGWSISRIDRCEVDERWMNSEMLLKGLIGQLGYEPSRKQSVVSEVYIYELVEKDAAANLCSKNWSLLRYYMMEQDYTNKIWIGIIVGCFLIAFCIMIFIVARDTIRQTEKDK